jgi:hypothetical protein
MWLFYRGGGAGCVRWAGSVWAGFLEHVARSQGVESAGRNSGNLPVLEELGYPHEATLFAEGMLSANGMGCMRPMALR